MQKKRSFFERIIKHLQPITQKAGPYVLFAYYCLCLTLFAADFIPHVFNRPYLVNDDCLQQLFIFSRDNSESMRDLFPAAGLYTDLMPMGYKAIYRAAAQGGMEPVTFSKILTFTLFSASAIFLAWWGWRYAGLIGAVLGFTYFFIFIGFYERMAGGLPRAFGYPLALLFITGFLDRRIWLMATALWAGALFYPPLCPFMAIASTIAFLLSEKAGFTRLAGLSLPRRLCLLAAIGAVSLLLISPVMIKGRAWGPLMTGDTLRDLPEMQAGGRYDPPDRTPSPPLLEAVSMALNQTFLISGADGPVNPRQYILPLILLATVPLFFARQNRKRPLIVLWLSLFSLYWLAAYFYPLLYLPTRNFIYLLPVLLTASTVLAVSSNILKNNWLRAGITGLLTIIGIVNIHQASIGYRYDFSNYARLYRHIATLPRDSVIAGWPTPILDAVPLFGHRPILAGFETYQLFYKSYLETERERMRASLTLIFTDRPKTFKDTAEKYRVDFLLLPKVIYLSDCNRLRIFRPFTGIARSACNASSKPVASTFKPVWKNRDFVLIEVRE